MFGIFGTIINFGIIAPLIYVVNKAELFSITFENTTLIFTIKEILLFSAVISATDTVSALTFIKEQTEPKLFAMLFGEGVMNDAVCIVLYRIIRKFNFSNEGYFN
jgi:NhaP-type Na+/H+ or K+/H+ antiporter